MGHYDIVLELFAMEVFSHIRDKKVKKELGGINMVELQKNRA